MVLRLLTVEPTICSANGQNGGINDFITFDVEFVEHQRRAHHLALESGPATGRGRRLAIVRLSEDLSVPADHRWRGRRYIGDGEILYGDPGDPFTVHQLPANESVVLRVATACRLWLSNNSRTRLAPGASVDLKVFAHAAVWLNREGRRSMQSEESEAVTLTVLRA